MIPPITYTLFNKFPRNVGNPHQRTVSNLEQFETFVKVNNGIKDIYVCAFNVYGDKHDPKFSGGLDKIVFDFDNGKSFLYAKHYFSAWTHLGFTVIPDATRIDGYHLYIPFKESFYSIEKQKDLLYKIAYWLLLQAHDKIPTEVDTSIIGDFRRIIRIPGSQRPDTKTYVSILPDWFPDMTEDDIYSFINGINTEQPVYKFSPANWEEFEDVSIPSKFLNTIKLKEQKMDVSHEQSVSTNGAKRILKLTLPECLYTKIMWPNPPHVVRKYSTILLLQTMSVKTIVKLYKSLNWIDWCQKTTIEHVESLKNYQSSSCFKLNKLGLCDLKHI